MNLSRKKKHAHPVELYTRRKPFNPQRKRGVHKRYRSTFWLKFKEFLWPSMGMKAWGYWAWLRLVRQADSPHHIAFGVALGVWISFCPLIGTHTFIALFLIWLLGGSFLAAFVGLFFGNPWTFPLIWAANYRVGTMLLGLKATKVHIDLTALSWAEIWRNLESIGHTWLWPTMVGGAVLGLPFALLFYIVVYINIQLWTERRKQRKAIERARFEKEHNL
jgi:uncharacterized protein (DUF2062 family)